jgi:membrane protease YdiL (CAAX protease family)
MKKIYQLLAHYVRFELKATYMMYVLLFLFPAIALNYYFDFESSIVDSFKGQPVYFFLCFVYYAVPLYYAVTVYIVLFDKWQLLQDKKFLFVLFLFPCIMAFEQAFNLQKQWVSGIENEYLRYYVKRTMNHTVRFLTYFLPITLYYIFLERENKNFYGLAFSKVDIKPYLFMMFVIMMPLIIAVSFTKDFQASYPIYSMSNMKDQLPGAYWQQVAVFESQYLLDFVNIELMFRGCMIHVLYTYMGVECVLAVATVYCTFHFGKPMLETISSFVGGTVLGILSLRTQSLYGGIFIHMGIAFMMEAASFAQQL